MPPSFQHDYDASTAGLTTALAAVERDAAALGFGPATQTKLRLVVEELYTNVLRHSAAAAGPVRISLQRVAPGQARLQFEDGATAFDPFNATAAAITAAELHAPVQDRPVGRLGMVLVRGLAVSATYVRDTGRNCVEVVITDDDQRPGDTDGTVVSTDDDRPAGTAR